MRDGGAEPTPGLPAHVRRFPFPFPHGQYMYSVNVEPAGRFRPTAAGGWGRRIVEVDDDYSQDLSVRRSILARDPSRAAETPHLRPSVWGALNFVLTELAGAYPDSMRYERSGTRCRWTNQLTGTGLFFTYGDDTTVPGGPLRFLSSQMQEDFALLHHREGALWLDAGVVTFASNWSLRFDVGLPFSEIHAPVPRVADLGVIERAEKFLIGLQPGEPYRRTNWSVSVDRRLDISTETYPEWGPHRASIAEDPALPDRLHLRVEVQHLIKVPSTGGLLFLIRTHLLSLRDLALVPVWRARFGEVLRGLPEDLVEYKGLARIRGPAADWLLGSGKD
ncbi:DUF3445 domain-containing protein [Arthrobacter sp. Sa2BUA2]|uniref:DUF3445 domain-containing protein n=1 Tax=Arthrobacter pullicola TaxID=2762224 RepID=A0ABR8YI08_9MICC|nr:DUF3445 domain-containing protein [Arthrobacter pullicola]MBD8043834.1 DUF3445 domain-containing protein [Arthrobacter pullicola]